MTYVSGESADHNRKHSLKCEIAAETLRSFGSLRLQVTGHSMLPFIWPGDTLVIKQCGFADIATGDIVLYCRQDRLFAHRVLRIIGATEKQLINQGDALPNQDAPVSSAELLGRVSQIVRSGRCIHLPARPTLPARFVARVLRRSASLSRLLVHLRGKRANSRNSEALCHT